MVGAGSALAVPPQAEKLRVMTSAFFEILCQFLPGDDQYKALIFMMSRFYRNIYEMPIFWKPGRSPEISPAITNTTAKFGVPVRPSPSVGLIVSSFLCI